MKSPSLPNVVVTPHIDGSTREAMTRVAVQVVKNIFTILEGERPIHASS
jgi:phosphoglycerate dehydrogenase-like enzyme